MHSIWFQKKDIIEWKWERWSISADLMNQLFSEWLIWFFFRMYKIWLLKLGALDIIPVFTMDRSPVHHSHLEAILGLQSTLCSHYWTVGGKQSTQREKLHWQGKIVQTPVAGINPLTFWTNCVHCRFLTNFVINSCKCEIGFFSFSLEEQHGAAHNWSHLLESFKKSQLNYKTSIFIF